MPNPSTFFRAMFAATSPVRLRVLIAYAALALASLLAISAQDTPTTQQPTPAPPPASQPAAQEPAPSQTPQTASPQTPSTPPAPSEPSSAPAPTPTPPTPPATTEPTATPASEPAQTPSAAPAKSAEANDATQSSESVGITEDELRSLLVAKQLFLRGGYLDNALSFNERGVLVGHSPQGSYTLCEIQIDKVHLTKHKVELVGERFGLHFLGALPYEDPTKAVDRVNITPKKKEVRITIDRELVVKPKEKKEKNKPLDKTQNAPPKSASATAPPAVASTNAPATPPPAATSAPAESTEPDSDTDVQAEIAKAPPAERPADANSVTTTISPAHATKVLKDALDKVFAQGFDSPMMDAMPDFWKLYYAAAANKTDYRPADSTVLRENMVDKKAQLVSTFEPPSNQYAQDHGVAGMSLYHVVVGSDGKPGEIAVARPIGFGLDESAVDSIRKATFEPAIKDGKPVPVMLNLIVEFRIYSKRTDVVAKTPEHQTDASLPGPYSVTH